VRITHEAFSQFPHDSERADLIALCKAWYRTLSQFRLSAIVVRLTSQVLCYCGHAPPCLQCRSL
jgi:hypothetical protein